MKIDDLEALLWQQPDDPQRLADYQNYFLDSEQHLSAGDSRHNFIIVIPVADRPQHLEACLGSTLKLCQSFGYGGMKQGRYRKVAVLVADDSKAPDNIERHRDIAASYQQQGLTTHYFGQLEQLAQLAKLDSETRAKLTPIIGDAPAECFYHKGASMMRNIAYLKLKEMVDERDNTLIYFIDSDQEFQVKVRSDSGEQSLYAINYLYQLDRIFRQGDTTILTGKVVGDPPVSPSVMAGNFLDDVTAFVQAMARLGGESACSFHSDSQQNCDDAAYHDMAELFGFKTRADAFNYQCSLSGEHDHRRCFADFSVRLNRFFDGEHPTRKSYYEYQSVADSIAPARTIYTGNYCFRGEALRYFIPFATLKLRMAGPVLGRIIKAEIGGSFVSANLPMLHKRTVAQIGESEFRPGIERVRNSVDLSGEFERQFFGDVMLFSMEELTAQGYPVEVLSEELVTTTVREVEAQMLHNYTTSHKVIVEKIASLKLLFEDDSQWWQQGDELLQARSAFSHFIANMAANFSDQAEGYRQIHSEQHRISRRQQIISAILSYHHDRVLWQEVMAEGRGDR